jgi:hypothetical protein
MTTMFNKRRWLPVSVPGLICVGLVLYFVLSRPCITKSNFNRIKNGMTRVEVEAILGMATSSEKDEIRLAEEQSC